MPEPPRAKSAAPPPHYTRWLYGGIVIVGILCSWQALSLASTGLLLIAAPGLAIGLLAASIGIYGLFLGPAVQRLNASWNQIALGELTEAERLLDAGVIQRIPVVRGLASQHHAIIAMRRGDTALALAHAERAATVKIGWIWRGALRMNRVRALALRALLRAASGDAAGAREDAEAVRTAIRSAPQGLATLGGEEDSLLAAMARAELAEAIVLERTGGRDALREHLARCRELLIEGSPRRERALVRAYERMLASKSTTPYRRHREGASAAGEEPPLADWMERFSPSAAAHAVAAPAPITASESEPVAPAASAKPASPRAKASLAARMKKLLPLVGLLIPLLIVPVEAWMSDAHDEGTSDAQGEETGDADDEEGSSSAPLWPMALLFAGVALYLGNMRRLQRRLELGLAQLARRDLEAASATFASLSESSLSLVTAQARLALARLAARRADFAAAFAHADAGIAHLAGRFGRVAASDIVYPELVAERAFAMAASGKSEEAAAEVSVLRPPFPFLARTRFRVGLLSLVREGRLDDAARLVAASSQDLPIDPRVELLADLVAAAAPSATPTAAAIERVERELRADPDARKWIEAVAPGLTGAMRAGAEQASRDAATLEEAEAEAEAQAETEVAGERMLGARS